MLFPEPPAAWRALLGEYGRAQARLGHLDLWWDAQVQRWLVVEHVPGELVPDHLRLILRDDPLATPFRARQANVWRETGKLPCAFFIIQGELGGHKLHYTPMEQELSQWYTNSPEPPPPGSLPYAPFDQRVVDQLRRLDWLQSTYRDYEEAANGNMREALKRMRAELLDATSEGLSEAIDEAMPALLDMDMPRVETLPDYDAMNAAFVETGQLPGATGGAFSSGPQVTVPLPT